MRAEPGRSNPPTSSPLHPLEKTNGWSQNEPIGGSILDAGNPAKGVNFARRFTLRIEKAFGVKMRTLLNMQAWHDEHAMRAREGEIDVRPYKAPVQRKD